MRRAAACILLLSCSSFDSQPVETTDSDGGAPPDAGAVDGGIGCPNKIVYVASDAHDEADGCSPMTAKRTIGAAIRKVRELGVTDHEIHVCAGTYPDPVTLDAVVSLRGGYGCTTFERAPTFGLSPIGADGKATLDPTNLTILQSTTTPTSLFVSGPIPSTTTIDGFVVRASAGAINATLSDPGSVAVAFAGAAAPTMENCSLEGAAGTFQNNVGSVAVLIDAASPTLRRLAITSGDAESTGEGGTGSIGLFARQGSRVHITESSITLGAAKGKNQASNGIAASGSLDVMIESNALTRAGGTGGTNAGMAILAVGEAASKASIRSNRIHSDAPSGCSGAKCGAYGIFVAGFTATIADNIVDLGTVNSLFFNEVSSIGIAVFDTGGGSVVDNVVNAGLPTSKVSTSGIVYARISATAAMSGERIAHNTVYAQSGVSFLGSHMSLVVEDNLLIAPPSTAIPDPRAGIVKACTASTDVDTESVSRNAFVGYPQLVFDACKTPSATATKLAELTDHFTTAAANVRLASDCTGESSCSVFADCDKACPTAPLPAFGSDGRSILFSPGWQIAPAASCLLLRGAAGDPARDITQATRGADAAKGAYVADAATCTTP